MYLHLLITGKICAATITVIIIVSLVMLIIYLSSQIDLTKLAVALAFLGNVSNLTVHLTPQGAVVNISNEPDWTVQLPLTGTSVKWCYSHPSLDFLFDSRDIS